jgi:hypothetical protein
VTPDAAVRGIATSALGWVVENRSGFTLGEDAFDTAADVNLSWKPLGELAQVCVCVRRSTDSADPLHRTASGLLDFAWRQTRGGALFLELARLEPFGTYPLEVYAAFAAAGLRHAPFEDFAAPMVRTRGWRVTEQQPNRRLGLLNSERRGGFAPHGSVHGTLRGTWLGGLPEPWTFERASGYALTHTVFHLTDWGGDVDAVPEDVASYLGQWLPAWLDSCLADEQWDLACELLAVAASLPLPPGDPVADGAWHLLAQAQDSAGALPEIGPGPQGRPVHRTFPTCYHSTLMAVFAAALTLGRTRQADPAGVGPGTEGAHA